MADRRWAGVLALDAGWALFVGNPGDNAIHRHHAIQLCVSEESLSFELSDGASFRADGIAIDRELPHRVEASGDARAALLYLEPDSDEGRRLHAALAPSGIHPGDPERLAIARRLVAALDRESGDWGSACALREALVSSFPGFAEADRVRSDPRVARAIRRIGQEVARGPIAAAALASEADLSVSRLAALFRRETGVAIRPFVLWTRLRHAVESASRGASLTEAAAEAGFADSAHLARTFRRMFGTTLSGSVQQLKILAPPR